LREIARFPTCGGTDVAVLDDDGGDANRGAVEFVVANSLTPDLRFAADTVRYQLSAGAR
jgi:hypothetical protein